MDGLNSSDTRFMESGQPVRFKSKIQTYFMEVYWPLTNYSITSNNHTKTYYPLT